MVPHLIHGTDLTKIIVSQNMLPQDDALRTSLQFSREDFSIMRKTHCFSVDRLFEQFND